MSTALSLSRKSDAAVLYVPQGALTQTAANFAEKQCAEAIDTDSNTPYRAENKDFVRYKFFREDFKI